MAVNSFIAALGNILEGASSDRERTRKLKELEEDRRQRLEDRQLAAEERARLAQERKEATEWLTFTRGQELANMDARPVGDTERALAALETPPETFQLKRGEIPTDVGIGGPKQPPIGSRLGPDPFAPSPFRGAGAVAGIERENQRAPLRSQIAQAVNVPGLGKYTIPTMTERFRKEGRGIASSLGLEGVSDEIAAAIGQNPSIASSLSQDSRAQAAALAATTKATSDYESKQRGAFAVLSRKGGPLAGKPFNSPEVQAFGNLESMLDMYKADQLRWSQDARSRESKAPDYKIPLPSITGAVKDLSSWTPKDVQELRPTLLALRSAGAESGPVVNFLAAYATGGTMSSNEAKYLEYSRAISDAVARKSEAGVLTDFDISRYYTQVLPQARDEPEVVMRKYQRLMSWGRWLQANQKALDANQTDGLTLRPDQQEEMAGQGGKRRGALNMFQQPAESLEPSITQRYQRRQ